MKSIIFLQHKNQLKIERQNVILGKYQLFIDLKNTSSFYCKILYCSVLSRGVKSKKQLYQHALMVYVLSLLLSRAKMIYGAIIILAQNTFTIRSCFNQ